MVAAETAHQHPLETVAVAPVVTVVPQLAKIVAAAHQPKHHSTLDRAHPSPSPLVEVARPWLTETTLFSAQSRQPLVVEAAADQARQHQTPEVQAVAHTAVLHSLAPQEPPTRVTQEATAEARPKMAAVVVVVLAEPA